MFKNLSKKNLIIIIVLALVVLFFGLWQYKVSRANNYSIVYLTTGEVYVGKLTTFPDFQLTNGYILQISKDANDPTKSNFQLNPISEALWAPSKLHLVEKNIIFYGPLLPSSKIAQTIAGQNK